MNITIHKTRIRPSITVNPSAKHIENDYGFKYHTRQDRMITEEVERLIKDDLEAMLSIRYRIDRDEPIDESYEKPIWKQGHNFYKAAYAAVVLEDNYNKALFWIRKAVACFEHEGVWFIRFNDREHKYITLLTDIQKDYEWSICATVYSHSFLGKSEAHHCIGSIPEEPDLTSSRMRVIQFNEHIKKEKDEAEQRRARWANR